MNLRCGRSSSVLGQGKNWGLETGLEDMVRLRDKSGMGSAKAYQACQGRVLLVSRLGGFTLRGPGKETADAHQLQEDSVRA